MATISRSVHDSLRGITIKSIREAWEVYHPEIDYHTFYYLLRAEKYSYLRVVEVPVYNKQDPWCIQRKRVCDAATGEQWESMTECAKALGVHQQAVQLAIKRKGRCKGRKLKIVEEEVEE